MRRWFRDHGLSIAMFGLFAGALIGQCAVGLRVYNADLQAHGEALVSLGGYLGSGHFAEAVFENWESEFLQMAVYVLLTAYLFHRGSSESKDPDEDDATDEDPRSHRDDAEAPGPVRRGGWRLALYSHSLSLALTALFALSFVGHAIGGAADYNREQRAHGEAPVSVPEYVTGSQFWFESFQNWQSEFLSVFSLIVLSVWLRERRSPESKPVHAPHAQTGTS